jgi:hypothetical protein
MQNVIDADRGLANDEMNDAPIASFIGVFLILAVIMIAGFMVYSFNNNATVVAPDMNAQQTQFPLTPPQSPTPGPAPQ